MPFSIEKYKYLIVLFVSLLIFVASFYFLKSNGYFLSNLDKKNNITISDIKDNTSFQTAMSLVKDRHYTEALNRLTTLEKENENSMQNLSYLRLKRLHILLLENNFKSAVEILEGIVTNPNFSNEIKARALLNIFTYYRGSSDRSAVYSVIFSSPSLQQFKSNNERESLINYLSFSYELYPLTVLGANIIYNKISNVSTSTRESLEFKNEISVFSKTLFKNSDKEINILKQFPDQESSLINIFADRAKVLRYLRTTKIEAPESYTEEQELVKAIMIAQIFDDPFYNFYTTFNYINYLYDVKKTPDESIKHVVSDESIFKKVDQPSWYITTIGSAKNWTAEKKSYMNKLNPGLYNLIIKYN